MIRVLPTDLNERERLLIMAAYFHGAQPDTELRANCWHVLRQGMLWAGVLNEQMESDTRKDIENSVIADWYRTLISMIRHVPKCDLLIEGRGNLGSNNQAPAFPSYTACGLTEKGRELAERLFEKYPQYRAS